MSLQKMVYYFKFKKMKIFYFNSGVKPYNTNVEYQIKKGNQFINGELHYPFIVGDHVPDGASLKCLLDDAYKHYDTPNYIIAEVLDGNVMSKYAVFYNINYN